MLKIKLIYILCVFLVLAACWSDSRYKGYTKTDSGLYYKLLSIGDGKRKPAIGDYLQLRVTYKTMKDSVFLDSYSSNETGMVILPFNHSSFSGSFEEGLTTMNEGDSTSFIVDAGSLFRYFFKADLPAFLKYGEAVKMDVRLNSILTEAEYAAKVKEYREMVEDRDIEEQRRLQLFLDTSSVHYSYFNNGMYYRQERTGTGDMAEKGDLVQISYKGCFIDGRVFESTYDRGQPLEFRLGEQGQVIKGMEMAISLLNEGAKAKFIITSQLAFGESGSSTGIVPPYSTLIYEIELLKINKTNN